MRRSITEPDPDLALPWLMLELRAGIVACQGANAYTAALALVLHGIDVMGWAHSAEDRATNKTFKAWARKYIIRGNNFDCTTNDLWGARCGLLHRHATSSRLSDRGEAKEIAWSWDPESTATLRRVVTKLNRSHPVVDGYAFCDAFWRGVEQCVRDVQGDTVLGARFREKVDTKQAHSIDPDAVDRLDRTLS